MFDYVLTIAISIAQRSGRDLQLPPGTLVGVEALRGDRRRRRADHLNMRGVKESVTVLVPIFITFLVTHVIVIVVAVASHAHELRRSWSAPPTTRAARSAVLAF